MAGKNWNRGLHRILIFVCAFISICIGCAIYIDITMNERDTNFYITQDVSMPLWMFSLIAISIIFGVLYIIGIGGYYLFRWFRDGFKSP